MSQPLAPNEDVPKLSFFYQTGALASDAELGDVLGNPTLIKKWRLAVKMLNGLKSLKSKWAYQVSAAEWDKYEANLDIVEVSGRSYLLTRC